ncbi:MAG: YCF48-related protein, partial [Ignavibacteria bacterium]|nr:YCF48-related protein [Ignavibacteria bacterium]
MKKLICFLLITIFANIVYSQSWSVVLSPDVNTELNDIFLINEQNGWIVGNAGTVLFTTNGGDTWQKKNIGFTYDLLKVFFIGTNNGWIGTKNGSILKTTDAGSTWTETIIASDLNYFDGIFFTSPSVGHILIGKNRAIYIMRTSDGGATWSKRDSVVSTTTASRWYDINFYNSDIGAAVGDKKDIQRFTTNGGITWNKSNAITDVFFRDLRAVRWLSENVVITLGDGNEFYGVVTPIYKSTDKGLNWIKKSQSPSNNYDRVKG